MAIPFTCPGCQFTAQAGDVMAGKRATCPRCKTKFVIQDIPMPPPFTPPSRESTPEQATIDERVSSDELVGPYDWTKVCIVTHVVAMLCFLFSLRSSANLTVVVHYVALMVAILSLAEYLRIKTERNGFRMTGIVLVVILPLVWWNYDYGIENWTSENDEGFTKHFRDKYWRASGNIFYRNYWIWEPFYYHANGGFSNSRKKHGKWHYSMMDGKEESIADLAEYQGFTKDVLGYSKTEWYWYGEEITEGEWHLRNK